MNKNTTSTVTALALLGVVGAGVVMSASAQAGGNALGAMGDSLTDEYFEESYSYAQNWVQQLVVYRDLDVGPTAAEDGQPGGTWGEPRRTGYRYNWARSGATSASLLAGGQHTGLADQIAPNGITYAVLAIGANDFIPIPLPGYAYYEIYNGNWTPQQIENYVQQILANINTALVTVLATDVELVLVNVLDYGLLPMVWGSPFFSDPDKRQLVADVIAQVNDGVADLACDHQLVLFDASGFAQVVFGTHHDLHEFLILGNVSIELWESDSAANDNPFAGFVHDGVHPHTQLQGVMANLILEALNIGYGAAVPLFSEQEILAHAGIAYGGRDTLQSQIGRYSDFVFKFAWSGDLDCNGVVGILDLLALLAAWGPCPDPPDPCAADLDGDGMVGILDLLTLLANWG